MITNVGKNSIGNMLASLYRGSLAIGVGTAAATADDTKLDFEVFRSPITVSAYDEVTNRIVVKTTIPIDIAAQISEIGVFSTAIDTASKTVVSSFDEQEFWTGTTFGATNSRVGTGGMTIATEGKLNNLYLDLANYNQNDVVEFAAHASAGGGTARVDLLTDDTNYHTHTFTLSAGYNIYRAPLSDFTVTGNPGQLVMGLRIVKAGAGTLMGDALRIHRRNLSEGVMLQRKVMVTPVAKIEGRTMDIEQPVEIVIA